jgi:4-diphosphocytidyl-2-C-methyl-D-erythritol kinase
MTVLTRERAPAKINLCLYLGPRRDDGRHELVTVFDAVSLFDELEVAPGAGADEVVCDGVRGPNLVSDALVALRATGWEAPPVRVTITKRIPVAAGMGGGSADAAALLRLAPRLGALPDRRALLQIAASLGADVPSQLVPGPWLGTGAGARLQDAPALSPYGLVVLPQPFPLSTADVYREADRIALGRSADELAALRARLEGSFTRELVVNDLEPAALSLAPRLGETLGAIGRVGADDAIVCGSGPTLIGLFWGADGGARAREAASRLRADHPAVLSADPVRRGDGAPAANE